MKSIIFIFGIAAFGALNSCSRGSSNSAKNCTVMKDGKLTELDHKYCDKLPESRNYPVRGY